jgi:non-heme chloroperoxidase
MALRGSLDGSVHQHMTQRHNGLYIDPMPASCLLVRSSVVLVLFLCLPQAYTAVWKDPSSHTVRIIEVEPKVKLEVLDWGGSGEPILLLSGHGDTGHVFDDFAPQLAHGFHVYAITRCGFGASSQPEQGYDLTRMVEDIARVTEALKLKSVNLVGHSIAGDEMTRFAVTYPERVKKLVYLEAAYDRVEAQRLEAKFPKLPLSPPVIKKSETPESIRASVAKAEILMPEAEIRATRVSVPTVNSCNP